MKKSKIILLFKIIFVIIFSLYIFNYYKYNKSKYTGLENEIIGTIKEIKYKNNKTNIIVKAKENILITIYDRVNYNLGDIVKINGYLELPNTNHNFNLFNYRNYLLSKHIYYIMKPSNIEKIEDNNNWYYTFKQSIINRIEKYNNSEYIKSFLLGDNTDIDVSSYRINGISHLFAISGMHINLITLLLAKILSKIVKKKSINNVIISLFLIAYMFLTAFSVSIMRASLMYILLLLSKSINIKLRSIEILLFILMILLFINPYYIYNMSFQLSFVISFYLIIFSKIINRHKNYFCRLFITSFICFLASIPIIINNFSTINFLSLVLNMMFIPFFTFIIFPLTLLSLFLPFIYNIFRFFIEIFNNLSIFCSNISILKMNFCYLNYLMFILYYIIITVVLYMIYKKKYIYLVMLILVFIIHYNMNIFNFYDYITVLDVGQGDCILINFKNNNGTVLIDTGGNVNYNLSNNNIIPYLNSIGVHKLNYLIISHGDYDHMGEAINLVNNFKVEKVIFNCGEFNDLEKELTKVLDQKKIKYYSCIKELNIDNNKLYFLQTEYYDNENDNSNVIYTEIDGYKFMFMGDAGIEKEKDILEKYNISDIDVLKVGHHGSKTSSSKDFIGEITPKYSIISVGKNNRYGHPNREVLNNLEDSKIYRTDQDGSIMFKIRNNKLHIETCTQ